MGTPGSRYSELAGPDPPRHPHGGGGGQWDGWEWGEPAPPRGLSPKSRHREWEWAGTGLFWDNTKTRVLRICALMYIAHIAPRVGSAGMGRPGGSSYPAPPSCWGQRWVLGTHWGRIGTHWEWIWPRGTWGGGSGGCGVVPDRRPHPQPSPPPGRYRKTKWDEWKLKGTRGRPRRAQWHSTGTPAGPEGQDEPLNIRGQS